MTPPMNGSDPYAPVATASSPTVSRGTKRKEHPEASRPKTMRACDRCRNKKTKCNLNMSTTPPLCSICGSLSLECTFDLPITESRQKRVMRAAVTERSSPGSHSTSPSASPEPLASYHDTNTPPTISPILSTQQPTRRPSLTRAGKTSIPYILHSTPTLPIASLEGFNQKHGLSMQRDASGNGYIQITYQGSVAPLPRPELLHESLQNQSWHEILEALVKIYFTHVSPLFPIITLAELFATAPPPPLLLYSICAAAACRSASARYSGLFGLLSAGIGDMLKNEDVLADVSVMHVQVLLILSLCDDLQTTSTAVHPTSVGRARLGAAIRMAVDLGLNEESSEIGQRVWSAAMTIDQWSAAKFGVAPLTHDPGACLKSRHPISHPYKFLDALTQLSVLLREILLKVYGANGIRDTKDHELESIKDGLEVWKESLPTELKFSGIVSNEQAGILHLLHTAASILFYRCFMRHSFIVATHISLNLDLPVWFKLRSASSDALSWVSAHEEVLDAPFMVSYAIVLCSLIQYHTWARRKESEGVSALRQLRTTIEDWLVALPPDFLPLKRAEFEVISVFLDAVERVHKPGYSSFESQRGLNPTTGVQNELPTSAVGFAFLSDCSRPSGGILVITAEKAKEIKDLPPGTIIIGGATLDSAEFSEPLVQVVGQSETEDVTPRSQPASDSYVDPAVFSDLLASFSFPQGILPYGNNEMYLSYPGMPT